MKIPLANQLKKRQQVETALLQDEIIGIIYLITEDMVLHGGTAIWRCYSGKRFSECNVCVAFLAYSYVARLS